MKKRTKLLCIVMLFLVSAVVMENTDGILVSKKRLYPKYITNPKRYYKWLSKNFTYQEEEYYENGYQKDYWKSPEETIKDKGGDCEDFGFLSATILDEIGYPATIVGYCWHEDRIIDGKSVVVTAGHVVVMFKYKNKWYFGSNTEYHRSGTSNIIKLVNKFKPDWHTIVIYSKYHSPIMTFKGGKEAYEKKNN